jgi:hypothetical protein
MIALPQLPIAATASATPMSREPVLLTAEQAALQQTAELKDATMWTMTAMELLMME